MLSVKLIDDYIIKSQDIKTFQIQLLRDGQPHAIPTDCTVTLLIANAKAIVKEEEMVIVDAEQGIVQFTLKATIGTGSFDCEFILSNGNDINLTFPDNGYTVLKISECLSERPMEEITPTEYEALNYRMDGFIMELDIFENNVEDILADYETTFAEMKTGMETTFNSMQTEFDRDVANLTAANNTFKTEMTNTNNTFKNEVTANVGTYDGRLEAIEGSVKTVTGLNQPVNTIENANSLVEVVNVQGNTLQNLQGEFVTYWKQVCTVEENGDYATLTGYEDDYTYGNIVSVYDIPMLKPNTTYTAFYKEVPKTPQRVTVRDIINEVNFENGTRIVNNKVVFTTNETIGQRIAFYYYELHVGEKVKFKNNIQILEGDWTGVDYVPFVDGIQSVDTVEVKAIGKNFVNITQQRNINQATGEIISNSEVIVTNDHTIAEGSARVSYTTYPIARLIEGATYVLSYDVEILNNPTGTNLKPQIRLYALNNEMTKAKLIGATDSHEVKGTIPYGYPNLFIYCYSQSLQTTTRYESKVRFYNIQLEEGATATEYEPYQETVLQIPLTEPLMKLPRAKVWDKIENGKIIRNVGKLVLDGTVSTTSADLGTVYRYGLTYDNLNHIKSGGAFDSICEILPCNWNYSLDIPHYYIDATRIWIYLPKTWLDGTKTGLQTYLQNSPITFYYTLPEPVIEEVKYNEILETYPNGHILLNGTVLPTVNVEYCVGLTGKVLNLEEELAENRERIFDLENNLYTATDVYKYWIGE